MRSREVIQVVLRNLQQSKPIRLSDIENVSYVSYFMTRGKFPSYFWLQGFSSEVQTL